MPEEIKIVVNQESKGNAIAETRAKIAELNKEAAFFEKQSGLKGNKDSDKDSALAKSIRAEANALQGDLSRQTREQSEAKKAAADKQRAASQEELALKRAGTLEDRKADREKEQAENSRLRYWREQQREKNKKSGEDKLGFLGGMGGLQATASVVGLVAGIVKQFTDFSMQSAIRSAGIASGGIVEGNATARISRTPGVRGASLADANFEAQRSALNALKDQRDSINDVPETYLDQFKSGMKNRFGKDFGETSKERERRELQEKITLGETELALAKKVAEQKFKTGVGGMELANLKARASGHYAEAKAIEWKIAGEKEYNRLIEAHATKAEAEEGKAATVRLKEREWQQQIGRQLTGRSGQAAIRRAADIAHEGFTGGNGGHAVLTSILDTMKTQHMDLRTLRPLMDFSAGRKR